MYYLPEIETSDDLLEKI